MDSKDKFKITRLFRKLNKKNCKIKTSGFFIKEYLKIQLFNDYECFDVFNLNLLEIERSKFVANLNNKSNKI